MIQARFRLKSWRKEKAAKEHAELTCAATKVQDFYRGITAVRRAKQQAQQLKVNDYILCVQLGIHI